jgi:hypothetical protein
MESRTSEAWTDDDRFFLVEQLRMKQRAYYACQEPGRKRALLGECKALEQRVDLMLANRKKPNPQRDLFGEEM